MNSANSGAADAYKDLSALISDANLMPAWCPDGSCVGFTSGSREQRQAWRVDLISGEKSPLLDVSTLRAALLEATGVTPAGQGAPFEHFAFITPTMIAFSVGADRFTYDLSSGVALLAPAPGVIDSLMGLSVEARTTPRPFKRSMPLVDPSDAYEVPSPDSKFLLSIQDHNVSLRATIDGRSRALTRDGTADLQWNIDWTNPMLVMLGLVPPVTNWSPRGDRLAAYQVDYRGMYQAPQVHYLKQEDEVVYRPFCKTGGVLEKQTLFVLDALGGRAPVEIQLGDTRDTYPCFAGWLPDGSELLVFSMTRDCHRAQVFAADPATGATRLLLSEDSASFVRMHHDIFYTRKPGLTITPDGQHLLWMSERDGWKHIYQYDLNGQLVAQLTRGDWVACDVVRIIGNDVIFTAHSDPKRPYDLHLCSVPLGGGAMKVLTAGTGKHQCSIAPDGKTFLDTRSTPSEPPVTALRRIDGSLLAADIHEADISRLQQVGFAAPEQFCVKAADGSTDLWGVMYKPHDFDPIRKYPVIEFIYGGPQVAVADHGFATTSMSQSGMALRIAQYGYLVVVIDARGTPERSKAFHDTCYGSFSGTMAADHAAALRNLAAQYPYVDIDRVGITGGSWGGYSSFRCLAEQPDLYKAAVCLAPSFDPLSCVLYECYIGLPHENPEGYRKADLYSMAAQVRGEVMISAGTSDHATWSDAVKMSEALIRAGKLHQFVMLPEQYHGPDSVHFDYYYRSLAAFFDQHVKNQPAPGT